MIATRSGRRRRFLALPMTLERDGGLLQHPHRRHDEDDRQHTDQRLAAEGRLPGEAGLGSSAVMHEPIKAGERHAD